MFKADVLPISRKAANFCGGRTLARITVLRIKNNEALCKNNSTVRWLIEGVDFKILDVIYG